MEAYPEIYFPAPSQDNTGGDGGLGSMIGAGIGSIFGPLGTAAGGFLGNLLGGGRPSGSNGGLQGALQSGLGALFGGSSSSSSTQVNKTDQTTNVNVQNVLGGRKFGNYDEETGDFDTFQAISDIFAIKAAKDSALSANSTPQTTTKTPLNFTPLLVVGGLAAVIILMRRK